VLVCNHVSFVDPLVLMAASAAPIRFLMATAIFQCRSSRSSFRTARRSRSRRRGRRGAPQHGVRSRAEALGAGELVAIFPKGRITDTGEVYPFRAA